MQEKPFCRVIRVAALPKEGQTIKLEANAAELKALAASLKLPSIEALTASIALARSGNGGIRATGAVHGELTQVCVVSLEFLPRDRRREGRSPNSPLARTRARRADPERSPNPSR